MRFLKIVSLFLCALMIFSLASCVVTPSVDENKVKEDKKPETETIEDSDMIDTDSSASDTEEPAGDEEDSAEDIDSSTDTEPENESETEKDTETEEIKPVIKEYPLIKNKEAQAKIVMGDDASRFTLYARDRLQLSIEDLVDSSLAEEGEYSFEILIGDTGREESTSLMQTLAEDEYAIKLFEDKIVIVASNEAFLYEAAKYFADTYLKDPYARVTGTDIVLAVENIDVKRAGDKSSIHYQLSKSTKPVASATAVCTLDNQKYGVTDADPRIYRRQGGCFNGEHYYQVFISKNEEIAVLAKKNVSTGELIYAEPRVMDHANDATYDPYNNRVIVGSGKTVWIYDADTLEYLGTQTFTHTTSKFSYCAEKHLYVLGSYYFYDDSLTYTGEYFKGSLSSLIGENNLSAQGSTCDDTFIYSLVFEKLSDGVYGCYFSVYDWYGNIIAFVTVSIPGDFEPENISMVDGTLYIAACSTQPVATLYKVVFDS